MFIGSLTIIQNGLVVIIAKRKQRQHVKLQLNMHISIVHVLDNQAD